jgi:hypothetical protein
MYSLFLKQVVAERIDKCQRFGLVFRRCRVRIPTTTSTVLGFYAISLGLSKQIQTLHDARSSNFSGISVASLIVCRSELGTCMNIQDSPVEIQNLTHWILMSRSVNGTSPVLSPSCTLPPLFCDCPFISAMKNLAHFSKKVAFRFSRA